jgi:hypothetical protein
MMDDDDDDEFGAVGGMRIDIRNKMTRTEIGFSAASSTTKPT